VCMHSDLSNLKALQELAARFALFPQQVSTSFTSVDTYLRI
jgi:hypothetical protein